VQTVDSEDQVSPEQIVEQGLRERAERAQEQTTQAVVNAAFALREFEIFAG
jgi:hypothetical protein